MRSHGLGDRPGRRPGGIPTTVVEANQQLLDKGLGGIRRSLEALVAKARMEERVKDETLGRLKGATTLEALKDADLVIEAITENQAVKNETFAKLDKICPPHALLATNTSSCNITAMAAATRRAGAGAGVALLQPGALDEAGGGGADHPDGRRERCCAPTSGCRPSARRR